jgi:hypothetical protein
VKKTKLARSTIIASLFIIGCVLWQLSTIPLGIEVASAEEGAGVAPRINLIHYFGYDSSEDGVDDEGREPQKYGSGLDLTRTNVLDEDLKQLRTKPFENVRWISLRGTEVSDEGLKFLNKLPLRTLILEETSINGSGFHYLKAVPIHKLDLENTPVNDEGLKNLKGLTVKELVLTGTQISDQGLLHLNGLPLKVLNLYSTPITDQGMDYLLSSDLKLEKLYLTGTQVNPEMVDRIRYKMPKTTIIY